MHLSSVFNSKFSNTYPLFVFLPFISPNTPPFLPIPSLQPSFPASFSLSPSFFLPGEWCTLHTVCVCSVSQSHPCVSGERERDIDWAPNTEHASASGSRQTWATQPSTAGPAAAAHTHTLTHIHTPLHTHSKRQPGGQHWQRQLPGRGQRRSHSSFLSRCWAEPQCQSTHGGADRQHGGHPHWNPRPATDGKSSFCSHCWGEDEREGGCLSPFLSDCVLTTSLLCALRISLCFCKVSSVVSLSFAYLHFPLLFILPTRLFFCLCILSGCICSLAFGVPLLPAFFPDFTLINLPLH